MEPVINLTSVSILWNWGYSSQHTALGEQVLAEQLLQERWSRSGSQCLSADGHRYTQPLISCPPTTHMCANSTSI